MNADVKIYSDKVRTAVGAVQSMFSDRPEVGVICGTGMGSLADMVESPKIISYDDIPEFPVSTVESHHGNLVLGRLSGKVVMLMQGRFHLYEGYDLKEVTFPIRVMKSLGVERLIVMNAVGSMNPLIPRGSIVLASDHLNLMGDNPLLGPNDDLMGPRFPDMSAPYDSQMRELARAVALENRIQLHEGVMVAVTGPCLETRAEYRMFQLIGADIVTMSTVPEIIVAVHAGIRAIALSVVTDECLPDALQPVNLEEIIRTARSAEPRLGTLVRGIIEKT
jgi:purine-nucleoside phosphorylase